MATYTMTAKFKDRVSLDTLFKVKAFLEQHAKAYNEWQELREYHKVTLKMKSKRCNKCTSGFKIKCNLTGLIPPLCHYKYLEKKYPLAFYNVTLHLEDIEKDRYMNKIAGDLIDCTEYPDVDIPEYSGLGSQNLYIRGRTLKFRQYVWHCSTWSNLIQYMKSLGAIKAYWESDEHPGDRYAY